MKKLFLMFILFLTGILQLNAMEEPTPLESGFQKLPLEMMYHIVKKMLPKKKLINSCPFKNMQEQRKILNNQQQQFKQEVMEFIKSLSRLSLANNDIYYALQDDFFINFIAIKIARRTPSLAAIEEILQELKSKEINPLFIILIEKVKNLLITLKNAAEANDIKTTRTILKKIKNSNFFISYNTTLIRSLLYKSTIGIFKLLLKYDNFCNFTGYMNSLNDSPNSTNDYIDKIKLLLEYRVKADSKKFSHALELVIKGRFFSNNQHDTLKRIKFLLDQSADVNYGKLLINVAIEEPSNDQLEIAQLLLQHGADVNVLDKDNMSAFRAAALRHNVVLIKLLLDYSDPTTLNPYLVKQAIITASQNINNLDNEMILDIIDEWALKNNFDFGFDFGESDVSFNEEKFYLNGERIKK
jgi:hypothetical protein